MAVWSVLDARAMTLRSTFALLLLLTACDDGAAPLDAATPPDASADAGPPDAGVAFDPSAVRFDPATPEGDGPWGLWGTLVARVDDRQAYVVGGTNVGRLGGEVFADVWRVSAGETLTAERLEATGPAPRYCGCAAWDPDRERLLVYGGRDLTVNAFDPETWELDPAGPTWTRIEGATQHATTLGCAMGYARGAMYLFGGANGSGVSAALHRFDAAAGAWVEVATGGPVARYDAALFPAPDGDALYLFGGSVGARGRAFYADLWRLDPETNSWTELALPEGPSGRRTPWVTWDPTGAGLYVGFGYDGEMRPIGDLFHADLDALTWTELEVPFEGPSPRGFSYALPGGPGALASVVGGNGVSAPVTDAWRLLAD